MKKIFVVFMLVLSVFAANAAELFYSDGTSISMKKANGFSAVKSDVLTAAPKNGLYRFNLGKSVISVISGNSGELPVYFFGETPTVAERTVFWRGERSVEYMEKKYGMKLVEILPTYPLYAFSVNGDSVEIAEKIVKNGDGYAFPNLVRKNVLNMVPESAPKDPYFDMQWHLQNTGTVKNSLGEDVSIMENADAKFIQMLEFLSSNNIEVDTNTKIAIMDSGVANHEDLNIFRPGYDAVRDDDTSENAGEPNLSMLNDDNLSSIAHGTECAGISAGVGNETGMSGVCPWCMIYPVRYAITDTFENGEFATDSNNMLKIYEKYVADSDITTVNCSFGPSAEYGIREIFPDEEVAFRSFMQQGRGGKGGVIVYASGNDGVDSSYDRLLEYDFKFERNGVEVTDRVVTVNASTAWDTRAEYSNFGYASTVTASSASWYPSLRMATTTITGKGDYKNDYTLYFGGTSAATPVVSGLFGVIFSINPDLTLEEAIDILKQSADKINPETGFWDESGFSVKYGYGRVNLEKAVRLAAGFPMCAEVKEEECGNHLDDDCDGYVDEGCSEELTAGKPCKKEADCLTDSLTSDEVKCLKEYIPWAIKDGYCLRRSTNNAPCPDGTKALYTVNHAYCALECNKTHPCERAGYYCTDEVLGICLPLCSDDSDCTEGYVCDEKGKCKKPIGGRCSENDDCSGEFTTCSCFNNSDCTEGYICNNEGKCEKPCSKNSDCAEGYTCNNGSCCNEDECYRYVTTPEIGYCTQVCYDNDDSYCPNNAKCVTTGTDTSCLASCASDEECRRGDGYVCHLKMGSQSGVCHKKCSEDSECNDEDAVCSKDGHCVPKEPEKEPENDADEPAEDIDETNDDIDEPATDNEPSDEEAVSDEDLVAADEGSEEQVSDDTETENKKKSSGCSLVTL